MLQVVAGRHAAASLAALALLLCQSPAGAQTAPPPDSAEPPPLDPSAPLAASWQPDLLDGVAVVRGTGRVIDRSGWEDRLYRPFQAGPAAAGPSTDLVAIPYYAWENREAGAMRVWIPLT